MLDPQNPLEPGKEELRFVAYLFIDAYFVHSQEYSSCYSLKQAMTSRIGYFYEADMYDFFKERGYRVKIDNGCHLVRAKYGKKTCWQLETLPTFGDRKLHG